MDPANVFDFGFGKGKKPTKEELKAAKKADKKKAKKEADKAKKWREKVAAKEEARRKAEEEAKAAADAEARRKAGEEAERQRNMAEAVKVGKEDEEMGNLRMVVVPPPPPSTNNAHPSPANELPMQAKSKADFIEWVMNGTGDYGESWDLLFGHMTDKIGGPPEYLGKIKAQAAKDLAINPSSTPNLPPVE